MKVQFSKIVVIAVTLSVTLICAVAMLFCWKGSDFDNLIKAVTSYIGYATIVFAAYSGNSAVEKWLIRRYADNNTKNTDDNG